MTYIDAMSLRPLYGHRPLRERLAAAVQERRLPASLLLVGNRGVGKQRLALWLGQLLLCDRPGADPCGQCAHCRYAERGQHPDLHWVFPQSRKELGNDRSAEDVLADTREGVAERIGTTGLWQAPDGSAGIFLDTMKLGVVRWASKRPAMARRAVFVIGDAERLVSQSASPEAANSFLKVLEEPSPDTTVILTSSEPSSLLPTIKSRVITLRVAPLSRADLCEFLDDPVVSRALSLPREEAIGRAQGAPGQLLAADHRAPFQAAQLLLEAAVLPPTPEGTATRLRAAARQGVSGARGAFSDMLDALTSLLHARCRQLVSAGREADARRTAMTIPLVEQAKELTQRNIHPSLLTASLLRDMQRTLHP